jgi:hypothetical protein
MPIFRIHCSSLDADVGELAFRNGQIHGRLKSTFDFRQLCRDINLAKGATASHNSMHCKASKNSFEKTQPTMPEGNFSIHVTFVP